MAEGVLFDVAEQILTNLGFQLPKEIGLLWGVKDEIDKLKRTVSTIKAVLLDAEEKSVASEAVRVWLEELKVAMSEADDLVDDFSTEALRRKVMSGNKISKEVRLFFSSSNQLVYGLRLAYKIKKLRGRLDEIANSRTFQLVERPFVTRVMPDDRKHTHSHPPEIVIGRDADVEAISEVLLSSNWEENVGTLPIVGIGGLGKTTLAQKVFNNEKVIGHFEMRMWACVADNFDVKLIVEKILSFVSKERPKDLEIVSKERPKDLEMDTLVNLLHEKISGKKYLIVLDDVWNEDMTKWFSLKDLLVGGLKGSRIIITTRSMKVAQMTRPIKIHELQGLSTNESWLLFTKMALREGQVLNESDKKIGEEMVAKCSGVPLALKVIGSLMYIQSSIVDWSYFRDKEILSIGQAEKNILPILRLSYDYLPSHLKHCFAYCSIFPKDHEINVSKLINLWMAQGYVRCLDYSHRLEDVGFRYFSDLVRGSFFQDLEKDELGNVTTCKMHDFMHDLAVEVAESESVVSNSKGSSIIEQTRHVSFYLDDVYSLWKVPTSILEAKDVRTFLLLHESDEEFALGWKIEEDQLDAIFSNVRRLRVLDLHNVGITMVPRHISKLKYLRHIDLSYNENLEMLPNSITELQNLQVLNLEWCTKLKELPKDSKKLVNLNQLNIDECEDLTHMPKGLGELTLLSMLTCFVLAKDGSSLKHAGELNELGRLNNLGGLLKITNMPHGENAVSECRAANLREKQHLQSLDLRWQDGDHCSNEVENIELALEALQPHSNLKKLSVRRYQGSQFPDWLSSLTNLVKIQIIGCHNCRHLPPLHQLPSLVTLHIFFLSALEYMEDNGESCKKPIGGTAMPSFFPSLKTLYLQHCHNLKGWWKITPTTHLPRFNLLSKLKIDNCPKITAMPLFPPLSQFEFLGASMKSLEDILNTIAPSSSSSSSSSSRYLALSELEYFKISHIQDIEYMPEDMLGNLTSLKTLIFYSCPKLKPLDRALRHLTSLEELKIYVCAGFHDREDYDEDEEGLQWAAHIRLCHLVLWDLQLLVYLPKWIRHISTLKELEIGSCPLLETLPEWMRQLNSLQKLIIWDCPKLSERCGSNKGEDWKHIAHIPNIKVEDTVVQRNGHYLLQSNQ